MVQLHLYDELQVVADHHDGKIHKHRGHEARAIHDVSDDRDFEDARLVSGLVFSVQEWGNRIPEAQVSFNHPEHQVKVDGKRR